MKQFGILLFGIFMIQLVIAQGGQIWITQGNQLVSGPDPGSGAVPVTTGEQAFSAANHKEFFDTKENWGQMSKDMKKEYMEKRTGSKIEGDPKDFRLDEEGALVDGSGKEVLPKGVLETHDLKFHGSNNLELTQGDTKGYFKWHKSQLTQLDPKNFPEIPKIPLESTNIPGSSGANTASTPGQPRTCGPWGCSPKSGSPTAVPQATAAGAAIGQQLGQAGFGTLGQTMGGALGAGAGALAGAAGGDLNSWLNTAVQYGSQAAQTVAGLIKPKENQIPPTQDPSAIGTGPSLENQFRQYYASLQGNTEVDEDGNMALSGDAIGAFLSGGSQSTARTDLLIGQTEAGTRSTISEGGGNTVNLNGIVGARPKVAVVSTPSGQKTAVNFDDSSGDSPNFLASTTQTSLRTLKPSFVQRIKNLFPLNSLITGKAISTQGQSVDFKDYDLTVKGNNIKVLVLRTFEEVEYGGNDLDLYNGNIHIQFKNQRIMYPRKVENAPFGIQELTNTFDTNNIYQLQHYEDHLQEFTDQDNIIYVTDIVSQVGQGPYARLPVNRDRLEMFS